MRVLFAVAVITIFGSLAAFAKEHVESRKMALELGNIIASEKLCKLKFNQSAIDAYVKNKVPADDKNFSWMLDLAIGGYEYGFKTKSETAKSATCAQAARAAERYGFIENDTRVTKVTEATTEDVKRLFAAAIGQIFWFKEYCGMNDIDQSRVGRIAVRLGIGEDGFRQGSTYFDTLRYGMLTAKAASDDTRKKEICDQFASRFGPNGTVIPNLIK